MQTIEIQYCAPIKAGRPAIYVKLVNFTPKPHCLNAKPVNYVCHQRIHKEANLKRILIQKDMNAGAESVSATLITYQHILSGLSVTMFRKKSTLNQF